MKKIKIYLSAMIFILTLLFSYKVNAAGTISLSASKSTVNVGDEFSISINLSGASVATLTARVSVDTSKVSYVSGPSNSSFVNGRAIYTWTDPTGGENPKTSGTIVTFKFKAKQAGKAGFSVSGDFYSPDEKNINPTFSGTSVTIQEKTTTPPESGGSGGTTGGGNTGGNTGGSTGDGTGSGTTGGSGNTGGTNQGGTTGGETSSGGTSGGGTSSGGTSSGATSSGGTTATVSKNANLKELHLDAEGLSPAFNKNTTNYNIVVGNDKENININAVPEDSNAKVSITGNKNLKVGTNKITIKVTAQDNKTTKTYTINATRTDNPDLVNANLENLAIENVILNPEFNTDIFEYTTDIPGDIESLNILAVPQIEGASVRIEGNENLIVGENIVKIIVTAKDGTSIREYIVRINKQEIEEVVEPMQDMELEEVETERRNNVGNLFFALIVLAGTCGVIFILIRKYMKER